MSLFFLGHFILRGGGLWRFLLLTLVYATFLLASVAGPPWNYQA